MVICPHKKDNPRRRQREDVQLSREPPLWDRDFDISRTSCITTLPASYCVLLPEISPSYSPPINRDNTPIGRWIPLGGEFESHFHQFEPGFVLLFFVVIIITIIILCSLNCRRFLVLCSLKIISRLILRSIRPLLATTLNDDGSVDRYRYRYRYQYPYHPEVSLGTHLAVIHNPLTRYGIPLNPSLIPTSLSLTPPGIGTTSTAVLQSLPTATAPIPAQKKALQAPSSPGRHKSVARDAFQRGALAHDATYCPSSSIKTFTSFFCRQQPSTESRSATSQRRPGRQLHLPFSHLGLGLGILLHIKLHFHFRLNIDLDLDCLEP